MKEFLICNKEDCYTYTSTESLLIEQENDGLEDQFGMVVQIVATSKEKKSHLGQSHYVERENFRTITLDEYKLLFPEAVYLESFDPNIPILSDDERKILKTEIIDLLIKYDYGVDQNSFQGIDRIINVWWQNNYKIVEKFKKHPDYNGKYQIFTDAEFERKFNTEEVNNFSQFIRDCVYEDWYEIDGVEEIQIGCYTYNELNDSLKRLREITDIILSLQYYPNALINHYAMLKSNWLTEISEEKERIMQKIRFYEQNSAIYCDKTYSFEDHDRFITKKNFIFNFANWIKNIKGSLITEEDYEGFEFICREQDFSDDNNSYYIDPNKIAVGQKVSRAVNKICKILRINQIEEYEQFFAKFSDAVNITKLKRKAVLSVHPVDFLTMSFGNSWSSCHTIDKNNHRNMENTYSGMYSGGTLSYMLDKHTIMFYTLSSDYDGNKCELQDKINRNLFHWDNECLVQGRVYPQATDGDSGFYKEIRNIVQKMITTCLERTNRWYNIKGTDACTEAIQTDSHSSHYRDYEHFNDCNVSYLKNDDGCYVCPPEHKMIVGHKSICPCCGNYHTKQNDIRCDYCE